MTGTRRAGIRRIAPALALFAFACAGADRSEPATVEVAQYSIEDFMATTAHGGASFSPDGSKLLLHHDGTGVFNAYAVPVDGGETVALTSSSTNAVFALGYFDQDERFLYTSDQGGNELNHIYVQAPDGQVTDLTPGENLKAQFAGWAGDYGSFYIMTNERDQRFFDLYRHEVTDGYPRTLVFRNDEGLFPGGVSPDGRWLALIKVNTTNDNDVYLHDLQSGARTHLTPHEGNVASGPADFSPDGRWLYYTTDEGA